MYLQLDESLRQNGAFANSFFWFIIIQLWIYRSNQSQAVESNVGAVETSNAKVNPFAGFGGLIPNTTTPSVVVNPFSGFSGLVSTSNPVKSNVAAVINTNNGISNQSNNNNTTNTQIDIKTLNESFLQWIKKQSHDCPLGLWQDGVQVCLFYIINVYCVHCVNMNCRIILTMR